MAQAVLGAHVVFRPHGLLNRKIVEQSRKCAICPEKFTDYNDIVPDHKEPKGRCAVVFSIKGDQITAKRERCGRFHRKIFRRYGWFCAAPSRLSPRCGSIGLLLGSLTEGDCFMGKGAEEALQNVTAKANEETATTALSESYANLVWLRGFIQAIPYAGGALDTWMGGPASAAQKRRVEQFMKETAKTGTLRWKC